MAPTDRNKKVGFFDHLYYTRQGEYQAIYNPYSYRGPFVFPRPLYTPLKEILNGTKTVAQAKQLLKQTGLLSDRELLYLIRQLKEFDLLSYDGEKNRLHINPLSNPNKGSFWIDLTNQCNFRCTYCYIDRNKEVIDPKKFRDLLDRLMEQKDAYPFREIVFVLAGGEPLLYFDIFKQMVLAIEDFQKTYGKGVRTEILTITNGSLITDEKAKFMKEHKVKAAVSFDGLEQIHNQTRQFVDKSGTFKYVLRGVEIAKKHKVLNNIITTVTQKNIMHLPEWVEFLLEREIGFQFQFYKKVTASCLDTPLVFNKKTIGAYLKAIQTIYKFYETKPGLHVPIFLDSGKLPFFTSEFSCAAGYNYFTITQNCELKVCPTSGIKIPYDKVPNFIHSIRERNRAFVEYSVNSNPVCRKCKWKYLCKGGCKMEQIVLKTTKSAPNSCPFYKKMIPYLLSLQIRSKIGKAQTN